MKAMLLTSTSPVNLRPLVPAEVEIPRPAQDEVLIRVVACGICRTDLHIVEGELKQHVSPLIPGHQVVGIVENTGDLVDQVKKGDRVGVAWLHRTCGRCKFCSTGRENLCDQPEFTGWTRNGGFAEYVVAPADFVYSIPNGFSDVQAAPLLCAGIIGYRALRQTQIKNWKGARIGIYGFGAAGHICIQIARYRGADVFVSTRDRESHRKLAVELGAKWVGDALEVPPVKLEAAIIFAPAGEIVPAALAALDKGGTLVLGGIHMSDIPQFNYNLIYGERVIRSVANNTRDDGTEFLREAAMIPIVTSVRTFALEEANDALVSLKNDAIRGAGVLMVDSSI